MIKLFALHDSNPELRKFGSFAVDSERAKKLNRRGYGIFFTFNDFEGARKKANLTKINFWVCDIDGGEKEKQMEKIKSLILQPSIIVESKNGYHCYWRSDGKASVENYYDITQGIAHKVGGDKACTDPLRLLRMPTYFHMKTPTKPFLVRIVEKNNKIYNDDEMTYYFKIRKKKYKPIVFKGNKNDFTNPDNWERLFGVSRIGEGNRNNRLYAIVRKLEDIGLAHSDIQYIITNINNGLACPLNEQEVNTILKGRRII